jgi:hypothetical protein
VAVIELAPIEQLDAPVEQRLRIAPHLSGLSLSLS